MRAPSNMSEWLDDHVLPLTGGASFSDVQATFQTQMLAATSSRPGSDSALFSPDQVGITSRDEFAFVTTTLTQTAAIMSHNYLNVAIVL